MVVPVLVEVKLVENHTIGSIKISLHYRGTMTLNQTENYLEISKENLKIVINTLGRLTFYVKDTRNDMDETSLLFAGFDIADIENNADVLHVVARSGHAILNVDVYKTVKAIIKREGEDRPVFTEEEKQRQEMIKRWLNMLIKIKKQQMFSKSN